MHETCPKCNGVTSVPEATRDGDLLWCDKCGVIYSFIDLDLEKYDDEFDDDYDEDDED